MKKILFVVTGAIIFLFIISPLYVTDVYTSDKFHLCTYVIDGDTIIVFINGKKEKVRLIGVDAPETDGPYTKEEFFGRESSDFTKKITEGKKVRLEYDWQKRDKYRRLLAYVYFEDGTFLNAEIIKQGYATAYTKFKFKYHKDFKRYEQEAKVNKRGLWEKE